MTTLHELRRTGNEGKSRLAAFCGRMQAIVAAANASPEYKKRIQELIFMAQTKIGQDFDALVARATADEKLIVALQAQVAALQAAQGTLGALSPEDQASETAADGFLATAAPTDTSGAETPPQTSTTQVGS